MLNTRFLLLWLGCVLTLYPAPASDFKLNGHTLTVPTGFVVEMAAAPPLIERPVAADFDEQGGLYVADSSGSNAKPDQQLKDKSHRVVRLVDKDGDGRFDSSTVFADRMMFPEGMLWKDGSVFVGAPPSIWKLTDVHDAGVADAREEWFQGKTLTGCANDLHGPYAGPDGWIYWCKGAFAQQTYERPGQPPFVTRAAHIFRSRADGTGIEPVMTGGMDNPVGVTFTGTGERILTATFLQQPGAGKRDGLIHAIYGGVYGKVHDVIDEHPRTGDVMPVLDHLGPAAPCGVTCYKSDVFGAEYRGNIFSCLFNMRKVVRHVLVPDGATYKSIDSDFLTSDDPDFHPTGVVEDADGSLIVLNTGGWYKLCCPTSQLAKPDVLGCIYRIRRIGGKKFEDPWGKSIAWAKLPTESLVAHLADERPIVCKRAIHEIVKKGKDSLDALAMALQKSDSSDVRRNALWALTQIDLTGARKLVRRALDDKVSDVRHVAVESASLWRDADAVDALQGMLKDEDLQVRRLAAEGLGRIGNPAAVPALLEAAAQIDSHKSELDASTRIIEHSIIYALIETANPDATKQGLTNSNPRVRRAALMALDQMPGGKLDAGVVTPLLASTNAVLKSTANWIVTRHAEWGPVLAGYFQQRINAIGLNAADAGELEEQLISHSRGREMEEFMGSALAGENLSKGMRSVLLRVMAHRSSGNVPASWIPEVSRSLYFVDEEVVRESIAAARAFSAAKVSDRRLETGLENIVDNAKHKPELRLQALAAAAPMTNVPPGRFEFLVAHIDFSRPWNLRNSAAFVLSRSSLDQSQLQKLSESMDDVGPSELGELLKPFRSSNDEKVGLSLVEHLAKAKALSSLRAEELKPVFEKYPKSVRKKVEDLLTGLNAAIAEQKKHIDELLVKLPKGDVRRGQTVFNSPKVACSGCHAIGYHGGHVGPDLTAVGPIRTERDLLESIVYPSASFVRSFEPMMVRTKSGDDYTGVLRKDSADEVVLATGPETEARISRADITDMHQGSVSIMPQGFDTLLTQQELADLVAFLKNTKWGAN